jgi:multidrug efflux pump subunit AcrA (membrane-fusion protein)
MSTIPSVRRLAVLWLLALAPLLGACASGAPGTGERVNVQVDNDLIPPTVVTVYAVQAPATGARRLVGTVEPSTDRTLSFDAGFAAGQYVFVARTTAGREIVSNPVSLSPDVTVVWSLTSNIATTR